MIYSIPQENYLIITLPTLKRSLVKLIAEGIREGSQEIKRGVGGWG